MIIFTLMGFTFILLIKNVTDRLTTHLMRSGYRRVKMFCLLDAATNALGEICKIEARIEICEK